MSVYETVLIYVGIPAAIILIAFALVYAGGSRRGDKRYRPGRPFAFSPVWFLSAPEQVAVAPGAAGREISSTAPRTALTAAAADAEPTRGDWPAVDPASHFATGGASDRW